MTARGCSADTFASRSGRARQRTCSAPPVPESPDHSAWFAAEVQPHASALRSYLLARYPTLPDVDNLVLECLVRVLLGPDRSCRPKVLQSLGRLADAYSLRATKGRRVIHRTHLQKPGHREACSSGRGDPAGFLDRSAGRHSSQ